MPPLLVQMPIFIGIFYVIRQFGGFQGGFGGASTTASEPTFKEGGLLWFTDLSSSDSTLILPILAAATMLASMEITNKSMEPQQRWLMRLLPAGFAFFTYWFPAGMFVYWITSNLVTLTQNYVIYNFLPGGKKPEAEKAPATGKPDKSKASSPANIRDNKPGSGSPSQPLPLAGQRERGERRKDE